MPQAKGKGNWMVNPRVQPPSTPIRLDNSTAKIENRYLNARLLSDIEDIDNKKYRKQADQNHVLKTAKKSAKTVFAQARVIHRWKDTASTEETSRSSEAPSELDVAKSRASNASNVSSSDEDSDSDEFQTKRPATSHRLSTGMRTRPMTSISFHPTVRSSTPASSSATGRSSRRQLRPKTVGPSGTGGQRSYQHLKDMVENDTRKKLHGSDAREQVMLAMAEKKREEDRHLQMRLQRFYTDLDLFIKKTNNPSEFRVGRTSQSNQNFLMQFSSLGLESQK